MRITQLMSASDTFVYRHFGKNWVLRLGSLMTICATAVHMNMPRDSNLGRWSGIAMGLGAALGQLASIAPAEIDGHVIKPDLPPGGA